MSNTTSTEQTALQEEKNIFIGAYLDKKMKGHGLDGMAYYGMLSRIEDKAERAWERKQRKLNKDCIS